MKLKENIDMTSFLGTAKTCAGDVFFHSAEGDILNMKSLLCQYILVSAGCKPDLLKDARIVCVHEADYDRLADFLLPDSGISY